MNASAIGISLCRPRGAALFAASAALLFVSSQAVADPRPCGCTRTGDFRWDEHLALWSNMVATVDGGIASYNRAVAIIDDAETGGKATGTKMDGLSAISADADELKKSAQNLSSSCYNFLSQGEVDKLGKLVPQVKDLFTKYENLKDRWNKLDVGAFVSSTGLNSVDREDRRDSLKDAKTEFLAAVSEADDIRYKAIHLACIQREWGRIEPLEKKLAAKEKIFGEKQERDESRRKKLANLQESVEGKIVDIRREIGRIAMTLQLDVDSSPESILSVLQDRTTPRVRVTFSNVPDSWDQPDIELKQGDEADARDKFRPPSKVPVSPRKDGPVFRHWTDQALDDDEKPFKDWYQAVSSKLELKAVWEFVVTVDEFAPIHFSAKKPSDILHLSSLSACTELAGYADSLRQKGMTDKGKVFAGWKVSGLGPLDEQDGDLTVEKGCNLSQIWETAEFTINWIVEGGDAPAPTVWRFGDAYPTPPIDATSLTNKEDLGISYSHWSLEKDGKTKWSGGVPLVSNMTVWAVPQADFVVALKEGKEFGNKEIRKRYARRGIAFSPSADDAPFHPGKRLNRWVTVDGEAFSSRVLYSSIELFAEYREERIDEKVDRYMEPISDRINLFVLAAADVALLALLIVLLTTGGKPRGPKPRNSETVPEDGSQEGESAEPQSENGGTTAA